ncbi:MAG: sporulation protein YqfD [Bacilli bacterium]|nr:sporulation protein YqfD [Bacilli bacterium]
MQPQLKFWRGYVTVELKGKQIEALLNLAAAQRLYIWNIRIKAAETAEFTILLQHFFQLRPLLRKTECRIHVLRRYGAPFFLDKVGAHKFLVAGIAIFVTLLFVMSSLIWQVKVEGNEKIKTSDILEIAKRQGIHPLQWKFKLGNAENLSREMHRQLPEASWVGVQVQGAQLIIKVVEAALPEAKPLLNPRHLVASTNAIVTEILAEKGKPMVKVHAFVRKGDVLISGVIGNEQNQQVVVAKGSVKGIVWYTSKIEIPLVLSQNTYTGETAKRFYLVVGNRALQLTGYRQKSFAHFTTLSNRKTMSWREWSLPIGWIKESFLETNKVEQTITQKDAVSIGMERAQANILHDVDVNARITAQKILHERLENGKVYMEVHFEVEQSITQEQPIIQGE